MTVSEAARHYKVSRSTIYRRINSGELTAIKVNRRWVIQEPEGEVMQHYQIRVTEYGQVCLRAPDHPKAVGMLWRINEHRGRSGTGHFGQAVLFPAQMRPGQNTDIDYRLPIGATKWESEVFNYFTGKLPEFPIDPVTREYLPSAHEWQWIDAHPSEMHEAFWYGMESVTEIPVSEYDAWLLTGEPMPGTVAEDAPDLEAQERERVAQEEAFRRQVEEENRLHNERMDRERAEAEDMAIKAAQDAEDERRRREQEMAEERERARQAAVGVVEYTFEDQMRDGLTGKSDEEAKEMLVGVLGYGGEYAEAARAIAKERGIDLDSD